MYMRIFSPMLSPLSTLPSALSSFPFPPFFEIYCLTHNSEFFITFGLLFTIFGTALNKEAAASGTSSLVCDTLFPLSFGVPILLSPSPPLSSSHLAFQAPLPIGFSIIVGVGIAYQFTGGSMVCLILIYFCFDFYFNFNFNI